MNLAGLDDQVEAVQGAGGAEGLDQVVDVDDGQGYSSVLVSVVGASVA